MLPHQLIPYQRYTVETILRALLLWREYSREREAPVSAYRMVQTLSGETGVTPWQLRKWLLVIRHGFLAAQGELCARYDFSSISRTDSIPGCLETVHGYVAAFSRGPPLQVSAVLTVLHLYGQITGRFLFGRPSQSRRNAC